MVRPSAATQCEASGEEGKPTSSAPACTVGATRSLRVGLPAEVIRQLYPNAIFQRQPRGDWPAPAYWLIHTRTPCIGACGSRYVTVPRLSAYVKAGRIAGFVFPVGAEGE
jgi:hypothetical protein